MSKKDTKQRRPTTRIATQREIDELNARGIATMHIERRVDDDVDDTQSRRKRRALPRIGAVIG